jgi:hypothetical protein
VKETKPKMGVEEIGPTRLTKTRLGKGDMTPERSTRRPTSSPYQNLQSNCRYVSSVDSVGGNDLIRLAAVAATAECNLIHCKGQTPVNNHLTTQM